MHALLAAQPSFYAQMNLEFRASFDGQMNHEIQMILGAKDLFGSWLLVYSSVICFVSSGFVWLLYFLPPLLSEEAAHALHIFKRASSD